MTDQPTDPTVDLIDRARRGDQAAWERLYAIYEDEVRRRIRSRLGPALRAQMVDSVDVMQSMWIEAFRSFENFEHRGDDSFLAWITTIMQRNISKQARKASRRGTPLGGSEALDVIDLQPVSQITPSERLSEQEDIECLRKAMSRLRESDREALKLSWIEGLKHSEIGERLGLKEDAARMRVSRAEAALVDIFRLLQKRGAS